MSNPNLTLYDLSDNQPTEMHHKIMSVMNQQQHQVQQRNRNEKYGTQLKKKDPSLFLPFFLFFPKFMNITTVSDNADAEFRALNALGFASVK